MQSLQSLEDPRAYRQTSQWLRRNNELFITVHVTAKVSNNLSCCHLNGINFFFIGLGGKYITDYKHGIGPADAHSSHVARNCAEQCRLSR